MDKFQKAIIVSICLVAIVAIFDFFHYPDSFWMYSFALGIVASVIYYVFKEDLSEAVAIFAAFFIMIMSGLEDLFFYFIRPLFQSEPWGIPSTLDHLYSHPVIGNVAKIMGLDTVTPTALLISIALGSVATYYTTSWLKKQTW